jgi:rubrerythrin
MRRFLRATDEDSRKTPDVEEARLRDVVASYLRRGLTEVEIERRVGAGPHAVRRLIDDLVRGHDVERCPVCGTPTVAQRCKASCPRCGYWRSCSDP